MTPWTAAAVGLCAGALAGCSLLEPPPKTSPMEPLGDAGRGRTFAEAQCSACHAVNGAGPSPKATAPPFAGVAAKYANLRLDWELEAISQVGHYAMPTKPLSASQIRDLDAYVRSLTPRADRDGP